MIRLNQGAVNASLTPTLQVRGIPRKYERMAEDGSLPVDGPQGGRYNIAQK